MKNTLAIVIAAFALAAGRPALGTEYHVAVQAANAADTNPGTAAAPWKTLRCAAAAANTGDTVWIHSGVYTESVAVARQGTSEATIRFAASGDEEITLDGADPFPAERWRPVPGFTNIYATPLQNDPGQLFVDGKPIYMKVVKIASDDWKLGKLTDTDRNLWEFDATNKSLLLNLGGGNPGAQRRVEIPVRPYAFSLGAHCRLGGVRMRRYVGTAVDIGGDDTTVEDCLVTDCGAGIRVYGWERRGCLVRRNTVIGALGNGIYLQDRPVGCRVDENLVIRCTLNPWHAVLWSGSVKMNSARDCTFAHNVVLEAGNPATINGWDGWALWGDCNVGRILYVGNTCAHNKEAGLYIEYGMNDTQAFFNTAWKNGHGITCRQSQRGVFMYNHVESCRGSGLAVWGGGPPCSTIDNVFAHNLVRDCNPCLVLGIELPQFADFNTYWPAPGACVAEGEHGIYTTLGDLRSATGHEAHGAIRNVHPAQLGLAGIPFRVPDAADAAEILTMIANNGAERDDPDRDTYLPYFWQPGTGNRLERQFLYAAYTGVPGGSDAFAYPGAGGAVALAGDVKLAHDGYRFLRVTGVKPQAIPAEGLGFWTPILPARTGDTYTVSFWVKSEDTNAPSATLPLAAFAEFTGATGQHRTRMDLIPPPTVSTNATSWTMMTGHAKVPADARRVAFFFGIRPAVGSLAFDDFDFQLE